MRAAKLAEQSLVIENESELLLLLILLKQAAHAGGRLQLQHVVKVTGFEVELKTMLKNIF